jgi:hypothetical protein
MAWSFVLPVISQRLASNLSPTRHDCLAAEGSKFLILTLRSAVFSGFLQGRLAQVTGRIVRARNVGYFAESLVIPTVAAYRVLEGAGIP